MASYRPKKKIDDKGTTVDLPLDAETLNGKTADDFQEKLTFDTVPTAGSMNPVTSDGIKSALEDHYPSRATANTLGLIKIGFTQDARFYPVQLDVNDRAYVHVPWVDTRSAVTKAQETADRAAAAAETNRQTISSLEVRVTAVEEMQDIEEIKTSLTATQNTANTALQTAERAEQDADYAKQTADRAADAAETNRRTISSLETSKVNKTDFDRLSEQVKSNTTQFGVLEEDIANAQETAGSALEIANASNLAIYTMRNGYNYCHEQKITSLNNITFNGSTYGFTNGATADCPCDWGSVTTFRDGHGNRSQIVMDWNNRNIMYFRVNSKGEWGGWQVYSTPITGLSISGRNITYTKADGSTGTLTTQDTDNYPSQATADTLGLIKIGYTKAGKTYPVQLDANGRAYVYVPWTDSGSGDFGDSISLGGVHLAADISSGGLLINGSKIATDVMVPSVLSEKGIKSDTHVLSRTNGDGDDGGHIVFNKPDGSYTAIGAYGGFRAYWFQDGGYRAFGVYTDGSITVNGSFGTRKILDAYGNINMSYRNVWGGNAGDIAIDLPNGHYLGFTNDGYCIPFVIGGDPKMGGGNLADTEMDAGTEITYNLQYANGKLHTRKITQNGSTHKVESFNLTGIYLGITEQNIGEQYEEN